MPHSLTLLCLFLLLGLSSCTTKNFVVQDNSIDWANTAWIFLEESEKLSQDNLKYQGFYLASDGKLFLINFDDAVGGYWESDTNHLSLNLLKNPHDLAWTGRSLVSFGEEKIFLQPFQSPETAPFQLNRVRPTVDLVENYWYPKHLEGAESIRWPANREIYMMLLPDAAEGFGILGYGGVNRFHGKVHYDREIFQPGPLAISRRIGPESDFENLYVQRISEASRYVQVFNDLYLYAETKPLAVFRAGFFN